MSVVAVAICAALSARCGEAANTGSSSPEAGATSSSSTSGGSTGGTSSGAASGSSGSSGGVTAGSSSGGPGGSSSGAPGGSSSGSAPPGDGGLPDGAVNMVPAGYAGMPFKMLTIPGSIQGSDYDTGGPGVAYCHAPGATGAACANGRNLNDWCCTTKLCTQTAPVCPPYRTGLDNAGLSHMNTAEPDDYPDGMPVSPYFPYLSYSVTGEWFKYTVQVLEAGTYSVGGLMAAPRPPQNAAPTITLDFGGGVTTGVFTVPSSLCGNPDPGCTEGYHVWQKDDAMATVTFPSPGTYVMTFTLVSSFFNPGYFTFTRM